MSGVHSGPGQRDRSPLGVSHVANPLRRYPGETVTFHTRVEVRQPLRGFKLQVTLPPGLILGDYRALNDLEEELPPLVARDGETHYLTWSLERETAFTGQFEYRVEATVAPTQVDVGLQSRALVRAEGSGGEAIQDAETALVAVAARGRYLNHLPSIYQEDELMGRFLMLFESFWAPVDGQIDNLALYFDPRLAPPEFLPWLASWISLVLDERWPEQKRRQLLCSAAALYRKRGTRQGLEEYLEIYTGEKPQIVEHRAHNFRLGRDARLGPSVALGTNNEPHTFTVILHLPPVAGGDSGEDAQQELVRRRQLQRQTEAIIDAEKPAHTGYRLVIREA
jgi:phage tail-like protein